MPAFQKSVIKLLDVARSQIGTTEVPLGSNYIKYNDWYYANHTKGAWCGAFVSWSADQAFGSENPLRGIQSSHGYVGTIKAAASMVKKGWTADRTKLKPGMVFIHKTTESTGHTGFLESVNKDGSWNTLEGNTDGKGSRTGGQVMRQVRGLDYMTWIFNVPWPADKPVVKPLPKVYDVWKLPNGDVVQIPPILAILLSPAQVADLEANGHEEIETLPKASSMVVYKELFD